jgi:thiol-disulfide isomerase/thioredoxin
MKSAIILGLLFSFCLGLVMAGGVAVAAAPLPETLTLRDLVNQPTRWPATAKITKRLEFTNGIVLSVGKEMRVVGFNGQDVSLMDDVANVFGVASDECDFIDAANTAWKSYTPQQRALDLKAIQDDASLWPEKVKAFGVVTTAEGRNIPGGTEYALVWYSNEGLMLYQPELKSRILVQEVLDTDLVTGARALASSPPAERKSRLVEALAGKTVGIDGKPDGATLNDSKVFVLFFGANWCGWCHKLSPNLVAAVSKAAPDAPKMTTLLMSNDEDDKEMFAYMKSDRMPFSAVPMAEWTKIPMLAGFGSGLPHVAVVDRYGKIIYQQTGGGPQQIRGAVTAINQVARTGIAR